MLQVLFYDDSTIEDLFLCAPAQSKTCLFFCQQFLSLGLELAEDNLEHEPATVADQADGTIVLTLLEVDFFGKGMTSDYFHSFGHS